MIERRMLRMPDMTAKTGLRGVTVYKHVRLGILPKPIKLGERVSAWLESEVEMVLSARIAGKTNDEIKLLVSGLMAARTAETEASEVADV